MQAFEKKEYSSLSGHTSASRRPRDIEPLTPAERPRRVLDADKFSREPVHLPTANPSLSDPDASRKVLTNPESRTQKIKGQKPSQEELDEKALASDNWLARNGHSLTFIGLYLFSILVLFRPYELLPSLGFLSATAFYFALATLLIYLPSQLATEGNATIFTTEIKAILALTALAFFSIPLAKETKLAWDTFNDPFIKAVLIFIVLVNVVRTRRRLMALLWLSIGIGVYLGFTALRLYTEGKFAVEEYRVAVDVGGLFGNPNDMALHFVMMTPIVRCLALGTRSKAMRVLYFAITVLFISANMVTFSRGGFLGFFASALVLVWKLGRKHRAKVSLASIVVGGILMIAAPGNYGVRMLSIFIPGLDPVGSSTQRRELLDRSLLVTARNPWGIGIGNFPIVGIHEHQTHNAYTQVSSEIGILGLIAYLVFIISPLRKLSAIERTLFSQDRLDWFYYLSIGLQASIIGYMVSSFFSSVAYNWFIYYGIAYAVAFRRIYSTAPEPSKRSVVEPAFAAA
ncbi:MAG: hypothetical protein DYH05_07325 [Acidobacteria bacterium ACB1]|nr:hypothetical protein [Acidobacteria bacterium ACB1]